jgi:tetratricopeptide (TPR) repeat protein
MRKNTGINVPRRIAVYLVLVFISLAPYWQIYNHDFIKYDDDRYVTENVHVNTGLKSDNIMWAFSFRSMKVDYWEPLTWISLMVDAQLFGLNASGYHIVNLLFHIINTLLICIVFHRMTGSLWRSAIVASLFAIHPLHVESVAWVTERKDVLSTFFMMLALWAYAKYAGQPSLKTYLPILLLFALGLMSKPMIVTLPCVFLLLDYWPLRRFVADTASTADKKRIGHEYFDFKLLGKLVYEKIPLFVLTAVSISFTLVAQRHEITAMKHLSLLLRIENALVAYCCYIAKAIWPFSLAVLYPHPEFIPAWQVCGSFVILVSLCGLAVWTARRYPYFIVGWLWYLGTLIPVIGLVQVGAQSMADRYTYIPLIGIFIAVVWLIFDFAKGVKYREYILTAATVMVTGALMIITWHQVTYWKNSMSLFSHTLSVTKNNHIILTNMGASLAEQGKFEEAIPHYQEALRIKPDDVDARYNLANALARQGKTEEAVSHYAGVLQAQPDSAAVHNNMGIALSQLGRTDEAIVHFREAIRIKPAFQDAGSNLEKALMGQARARKPVPEKVAIQPADPNSAEGQLRMGLSLYQQGKADEAIPKFEEALRLDPKLVAAHVSLGLIMAQKRNLDKAIEHFRKALKIKPDIAETHNSLGVALTYKGALDEAVEHFETAIKINPRFAKAHNSLAVALAQKGRTNEAISHLKKALQLQPDYEEAKRNLNILLNSQGKSS